MLTVKGGTELVDCGEMVDSSSCTSSEQLRSRLHVDGYLLLRGFLDRKLVEKARNSALQGWEDIDRGSLLQHQEVANDDAILAVIEHPTIPQLMRRLLPQCSHDTFVTTKYKWLRAVTKDKFTGVHTDQVYFGRLSPCLHTVWIPLMDLPLRQGTLLVSTAYHSHPDFRSLRASYSTTSVGNDGTNSGWLTSSAAEVSKQYGGDPKWVTTAFKMGDIVVLPPTTLHMSTANTTDNVRISCDTRWYCCKHPFVKSKKKKAKPKKHTLQNEHKPPTSNKRQKHSSTCP
eukprot:TRINITY_DN104197_c0_g1_i1.p1 TRINITY_DN104197_c0_g1~~TRINITY_DN104197_c0_g1_i1.p1  ORF type:complete len:293 (-),score=12.23 TRINITY_DN104197_c0_g1_i1:193-1050(-)